MPEESFWNTAQVPSVASTTDKSSVEVGLRFHALVNGQIDGVMFYKGSKNRGTHVGSVWSPTGVRLAQATFINETSSGWQTVRFATPVPVTSGTTYTVSYSAPYGHYSANQTYFSSTRQAGDLVAGTSAGAYVKGAGAYPTATGLTNYWVDVLFQASQTSSPSPSPSTTAAAASPSPSATATAGASATASPTSASLAPAPSPTPTATALSGTRDKLLWPFASNSVWNMPIGSGATYVDPRFYTPANGWGPDVNPIAMAPTAPLRPLYTNGLWPPSCQTTTNTGKLLPVPDNFIIPDGNGNLSGGILMSDGKTIQEGQAITRCTSGGPITMFGAYGTESVYGDGITYTGGTGGHGGSGLTGVGGSIRLGELTSASPIRHALTLTLDCMRFCVQSGGKNYYRWPANKADGMDQPYGTVLATGYAPVAGMGMGSLLAIPPSVDLTALGLQTAPGRKIAWSLQNYGAYVVDNAYGSATWHHESFGVQQGVAAEVSSAYNISLETYKTPGSPFEQDMNKIFLALRLVSNNGSNSIGGGGTPVQPLAPPIGN